jgi:hypothetical protein
MSDPQLCRDAATCSLLVYGSLMDHRATSWRQVAVERVIPVIVSGFSRDFCHEPSWRSGEGIRRGVLRLRHSPSSFVNAVLVTRVSVALLPVLDHRERGYHRREVAADRLSAFGRQSLPVSVEPVFSYEGRPELSNPSLLPNPEDLNLCLAAPTWGDHFLQTFRRTTLVAGGPLDS